jgi:hypothetical protein
MIYVSLFGLVIKSNTVYTNGWYAFTTIEDVVSSVTSKHQSIGWTVPLNYIIQSIKHKIANNIFDKDHTITKQIVSSNDTFKAKSIFKSLLTEPKQKMFDMPKPKPKQDTNQLSLF